MATKLQKIVSVCIFIIMCLFIATNVYSRDLTNKSTEFMELRVASIEEVDGADKQVILEWWSHNLAFKTVQLCFSYDNSKLKPSKISGNSYVTDDENSFDLTSDKTFEFVSNFAPCMEYVTLNVENGIYECMMALTQYNETFDYIENDEQLGYIVDTRNDSVLIGRMSFRLFNGEIDENTFKLKPGSTSPKTGITINQTIEDSYTDKSVFKFSVGSSDTSLNFINYEFFNYKEDGNLPELTHENSIDLENPDSSSTEEVSVYKIVLNELLKNISLKLQPAKEKTVVTIDGVEIDVSNSKELVLKELGESDTIIDLIVLAEDGKTTHTYELVVHRPFGTIKGEIQLDEIEENDNPDIKKVADLNLYSAKKVDWTVLKSVYDENFTYDDLDLIEKDFYYQSKEDGSYEIYVIPGKYDLQIDRRGFLDYIIKDIEISENETINIGETVLVAGDVDRDGVIGIEDVQILVENRNVTSTNPKYSEAYDLVQLGVIDITSVQYAVENRNATITIKNYSK